jgi:hypothetical protein
MAFNQFYNEAYRLYTNKKYREVLKSVELQKTKSGIEKTPAQLAYLSSLALGHLQKLDKLEASFKNILDSNPEDKLIVPLIKIQLAFIDSNRTEMTNRPFALLDNETIINTVIEEPIAEEPAIAEKTIEKQMPEQKPAQIEEKKIAETVKLPIKEQKNDSPQPKMEQIDTFFELDGSSDYYFIVNVSDPSLNLSSSRFGIGQFNRVNYSGNAIKHQLKSIANQNQLIFVGPLTGKESAQAYFDQISPLIREIMKIPATKYGTFFISDKNLEKITDLGTLERYVDFYKKNYNK